MKLNGSLRLLALAGCLALGACGNKSAAEKAVLADLKDPDSAKFGAFYYNSTNKKAGVIAVNGQQCKRRAPYGKYWLAGPSPKLLCGKRSRGPRGGGSSALSSPRGPLCLHRLFSRRPIVRLSRTLLAHACSRARQFHARPQRAAAARAMHRRAQNQPREEGE